MELQVRLSAVLAGRHEIEREIGQGGVAVVFLARDVKQERCAATSTVRPSSGLHFRRQGPAKGRPQLTGFGRHAARVTHVRWLTVVVAVSALANCRSPYPTVGSVEILPSFVYANAGDTFQLAVRLADEEGHVIPEFSGYTALWESNRPDEVALVSRSGYTAVFAALDETTGPARIRADVPGAGSRHGFVTILGSDAATGDWVLARQNSGAPPSVALVESDPSSLNWLDEGELSFTTVGLVDAPVGTPGSIAVFSMDAEMGLKTGFQWTGAQRIDFGSGPGRLHSLLEVPLVLWVATGGPDDGISNSGVAAIQVADASKTLATNRSGLVLIVKKVTDLLEEAHCGAAPYDDPAMINVFFVPGLAGDVAGRTCDGKFGDRIIFVSLEGHDATTLAHEVGHILSLDHAGAPDFDEANVMWEEESDKVLWARWHLSPGQVFRMNVHHDAANMSKSSWLNFVPPGDAGSLRDKHYLAAHGGVPAAAKDCDQLEGSVCPSLRRDVP